MITPIFFWSISGLMLSIYAVYIQNMSLRDVNFSPLCDVDYFSKIQCSPTLKSSYSHLIRLALHLPPGHVLDWSQADIGVVFYGGLSMYSLVLYKYFSNEHTNRFLLFASSATVLLCIYLGKRGFPIKVM